MPKRSDYLKRNTYKIGKRKYLKEQEEEKNWEKEVEEFISEWKEEKKETRNI